MEFGIFFEFFSAQFSHIEHLLQNCWHKKLLDGIQYHLKESVFVDFF